MAARSGGPPSAEVRAARLAVMEKSIRSAMIFCSCGEVFGFDQERMTAGIESVTKAISEMPRAKELTTDELARVGELSGTWAAMIWPAFMHLAEEPDHSVTVQLAKRA